MTFFSEYKKIYQKIPAELKGRFFLVIVLVFIAALAEVFSIASILPYLLILSKPAMVENNWIIAYLYNLSGTHSIQHFQILCLIVLLIIFLLKNIFILFVTRLQTRFVYKAATHLSEIQITNYISLNYTDIIHYNSQQIANNSMTLPTAFAHGILNPLITIISEFFILVLIFLLIIFYNFILLLSILVIVLPLIFLSYQITKRKVKSLSEQRNELLPVTYANIQEMVSGFIELKMYNKTGHFIKRFLNRQSELNQKQARMHVLNSIPPRIIEISALIAVLILSLFYKLTGGGYYSVFISIGVFGVAIYRLIPSFNRILNAMMVIQNHYYVVSKMEFENLPVSKPHASSAQRAPITFNQEINFDKVSFTYPGTPEIIFNNIDINIKKGSITGIAGRSGEGKSTFIYLLSGILFPDTGNIMIDNTKLNHENTSGWQANFGFVRHNNFFIDGTILENITLCDDIENIDKMQLESAIKNASLTSFIDSLPEGISTRIGESGVKISEGQKQRIAIARCIYKNASIIVFDEATSAIDLNIEADILENLKNLQLLGKTIIIISHKVSTLRICENLMFLKDQNIIKVKQPKEFLNNLHSELQ